MKNQKQSGSAHIVIIIVLVIAVLGLLGFVFWQSLLKNDFVSPSSSVDKTQKVTLPAVTPSAKVTAYTFDDALAGINKLLSVEACTGDGLTTGVNKDSFRRVNDSDQFSYQAGQSLINNDLTYAFVQYGCGSSGSIALLKSSDNGWKLVSEDARIYPMCTKVKNQGYPSSIIDKCYVDDNATDPVAI